MTHPLIIDSFAGGCGASTGIELALGRSLDSSIFATPAQRLLIVSHVFARYHLCGHIMRTRLYYLESVYSSMRTHIYSTIE
jgi:hypothetical protein